MPGARRGLHAACLHTKSTSPSVEEDGAFDRSVRGRKRAAMWGIAWLPELSRRSGRTAASHGRPRRPGRASAADLPGMPYITHKNGQTTHYLDDDFADPWKPHETIVIQHGFARHAALWYHWIPMLSRHYRVIRRDARGHGLSSFPPFPNTGAYEYSVQTIVDELIDTLDQLGLGRVHFIGESTSGILGCILAATHPERLSSLTICSSPTHLPPAAQELFAFGHADWPTAVLELGCEGWARALAAVPGTLAVRDAEYVDWWIAQVSRASSEGLAGYADFLCRIDCRPYLGRIRVPMLILAPTRSAATSVADQQGIHAQVEGSRLELIDAPGHEIYVQAPAACQQALLAFVEGLRQPGGRPDATAVVAHAAPAEG